MQEIMYIMLMLMIGLQIVVLIHLFFSNISGSRTRKNFYKELGVTLNQISEELQTSLEEDKKELEKRQ